MENKNINVFREIVEVRKLLKNVQQLSWDINNLEKRYPMEEVPEEDLDSLLGAYLDLKERLYKMALEANGNEPF